MMRALGVAFALVAPLMFPWPFAVAVAALTAFSSPLVALAAGLITDAAYFARGAAPFPFYSLIGGAITLGTFGVRRFVKMRIMRI